MPKITNEEIKNVDDKLKYIGLDFKKIPNCLKNNKINECSLNKEYRDTTCKVYKYVNVNDIQIFITPAKALSTIEEKCKTAKPIEEYLNDETLKNDFLKMIDNINIKELINLENEQNKFDISCPHNIYYKNSFKWQVYYCESSKKYVMLFLSEEKNNEVMFLLLKKQIEASKENLAIKIYIPIVNEGYSENFLNNQQITDIENTLWFLTKRWPSVYEVVDIYGNRSMHIIGKTLIYENIESYYKLIFKDKNEAIEKYELLQQLLSIESNINDEYKFNIKIDENGIFQIFFNEKELTLNQMDDFLKKEIEEKSRKAKDILFDIDKLENELNEKKQELDKKNEEYNEKQKQIVTFLQCKKTFIGRFKYFFKSNRRHKKVNRIVQIPKVKLIQDEEINIEVYEKKDSYNIDDLLVVCSNLNKNTHVYKTKEKELRLINEKLEVIRTKIKNADLYISEIESHKHSIFEFWKFTNKDVSNVLTEAEKVKESEEINENLEYDFVRDIEKLEKEMDNLQLDKLSKNEMDAVFIIKDYINILNILCKKEIEEDEEEYIKQVLEDEKQKFEKEKMSQNIIYYDVTKNININSKEEKQNTKKNKYKILNFDISMKVDDFKEQLLKLKKILEKAYNKITIPYNIQVYCMLQNNQLFEWNIASLDIQTEIKKQEGNNIDIIKYNILKESPMLFYTNHVMYSESEKVKYGMNKEKQVLLHLDEFELSLKGKNKERICIPKNEYENSIKTIKVYEYDLKLKGLKGDEK